MPRTRRHHTVGVWLRLSTTAGPGPVVSAVVTTQPYDPSRFVVELYALDDPPSDRSAARAAELERRMRRIAAEVRAADATQEIAWSAATDRVELTVQPPQPPDTEFTWQGVLEPRGTPEAIVQRLNAELVRIIRSSDVRGRLAGQGAEVVTMTPVQQDQFFDKERKRWAKVVEAAHVRAD